MPAHRGITIWSVAFFMAIGSVYSGPAMGEESSTSSEPAVQDKGSVFDVGQATAGADNDATDAGDDIKTTPAATDAPADVATAPKTDDGKVAGGNYGHTIDIHVKDLEVSKVLQLLSIQSRRNIVHTRNVAGTISADLYDVTFYDALDAILKPNKFMYKEKGNFIYVMTQAEFEEERKRNEPVLSQRISLNYLTAKDASVVVQPMLSAAGSVSIFGDAPAGIQPSISDAGSNSNALGEVLVVRDYQEKLDEIKKIIKELDIKPKQVMIEVYILEVSLTERNKFGVDFSVLAEFNAADFVQPLGAVNELISGTVGGDGTVVTSDVGNVAGDEGAFKIGVSGHNAQVFVSALAQVTDTNILAKPKLLVLNRQRANLLVGGRRGYVTTTTTETASTQTVEFLETGTQLTVRPFIADDGHIRLELRPAVSDGTVETIGDVVVPRETTQELTTNVIVKSGQTVILGGLFKEETVVGKRQVPWVGDIPILGAPFKGHDDTVRRNEYIFMVKPTVMRDKDLQIGGEKAMENIELARIGARKGLLPWSRDKMTATQLKKAMEARAAGDEDKALMHVNWALTLNPQFVKALKLKKQITGETYFHPKHQLLQDAVDAMIDDAAEADAKAAKLQVKPTESAAKEEVQAKAEPEAKTEPETAKAEPMADAEAKADESAKAEGEATAKADDAEAQTEAQAKSDAGDEVAKSEPAQSEPAKAEGEASDTQTAMSKDGQAGDETADASEASDESKKEDSGASDSDMADAADEQEDSTADLFDAITKHQSDSDGDESTATADDGAEK